MPSKPNNVLLTFLGYSSFRTAAGFVKSRLSLIFTLKILILSCFFIFNSNDCLALVFGEHQVIGDRAFNRALIALKQANPALMAPGLDQLIRRAGTTGEESLFLDIPGAEVTYGTLNALAGDHQLDPILMEEQLKDPASVIYKIIALHQSYIIKGFKAAPDGELVRLDYRYALAATINLSHFYAYGKSFREHLENFDLNGVNQATDRAYLSAFVRRLQVTNAIQTYVSLHLVAMQLAEKSGKLSKAGNEMAAELLQQALFLNGFADHFLEDAFSAGHLVVNRSTMASFTNNKALHDFYSEHGTPTVNRQGDIWECHGDGHVKTNSAEEERIITAVQASVQDIFNAYIQAGKQTDYVNFCNRMPQDQHLQPEYLLEHLPALGLVPVPYSFKLEAQMPAHLVITEAMQQANQPPFYRNFIKSRVGNSLVVSRISQLNKDANLNGFEFRVNTIYVRQKYVYNAGGTKKNMVDYWHGYTFSYQLLRSRSTENIKKSSYQFTGGLRLHYDYWLSDKRFLGFYSYQETGLRFQNKKAVMVLMPSLGINLGSLLNINYYNMPVWLRVPAMLFLPLKVRYGSVLAVKHRPAFFAAGEMDLIF